MHFDINLIVVKISFIFINIIYVLTCLYHSFNNLLRPNDDWTLCEQVMKVKKINTPHSLYIYPAIVTKIYCFCSVQNVYDTLFVLFIYYIVHILYNGWYIPILLSYNLCALHYSFYKQCFDFFRILFSIIFIFIIPFTTLFLRVLETYTTAFILLLFFFPLCHSLRNISYRLALFSQIKYPLSKNHAFNLMYLIFFIQLFVNIQIFYSHYSCLFYYLAWSFPKFLFTDCSVYNCFYQWLSKVQDWSKTLADL